VHDVVIRAKPPGMRAIHPSKYVFRSESNRWQSKLRAAWMAPEMFETGVVRAHLFPLRPATAKSWDGMLAVSFTVPLAETAGRVAVREFGAVLYNGPRVVHRFSRRVVLEPETADTTSAPTITFLERVTLDVGEYTLTAVLADPAATNPHAARVRIAVPEIPRKELFLVGPILGRRAGPNIVVSGGSHRGASDAIGAERAFEPLLVHRLDHPVDLAAFSQACVVSKRGQRGLAGSTIVRSLHDTEGAVLGSLPDVDLELDGEEKIHCQNLLDVIPASSLPQGEYAFEARLQTKKGNTGVGTVRFAVDID